MAQKNQYRNRAVFLKRTNLQSKLTCLLSTNGHKQKSEKYVLSSFKIHQKNSDTDHKKIFQNAVLNVLPIFLIKQLKPLKRKNRKEKQMPFIPKEQIKVSFALKAITYDIKKKEHSKKLHRNITKELLFSAEQKSNAFFKIADLHEEAILQKKNFFFKWF